LAETWPDVANIRIRCKGTIGGNIMAADPNYDFALVAMAAGARLHFLMADGSIEQIAAAHLDTGNAGLLKGITFPTRNTPKLWFDRSLRPIVTVAFGLDLEDGNLTGGRVAIGCAYAAPIVVELPFEAPLPSAALVHEAAYIAAQVAAGLPEPLRDHNATSAYRRRMIEVLLRRNLAAIR
jgi:carbon-monoxide dehydrogenase medium subunit